MNNEILKKLNEFAEKFDRISSYIDTIEVRGEDERGYYWGEEAALWGTNLEDFEDLLRDFIDFVFDINEAENTELEKYKSFVQWLLDQWELDTKEVQNKALEIIGGKND